MSVVNAGTIAGGNGGTGGASTNAAAGNAGLGGAGISGASSVVNSGTISGGVSGSGVRANAIEFSGSTNTLELQAGSVIVGNVVAAAGGNNTLILGGAGNASFDAGGFGSQYQNFSSFVKNGASTWTLTGTNTFTGTTTIAAGTLQAGSAAALGTGAVNLAGGTLLGGSTFSLGNDLTFSSGQTSVLAAATGTTLTLAGVMHLGSGATATFGSTTDMGTIVLAPNGGSISFPVAMVVAGGTLQSGNFTAGFFYENTSSTTVNSGATLDLNDWSATINDLRGAGTVRTGSIAAQTTTVRDGDFAGTITGAGQLAVSGGTLTLTGDNTYAGGTTVSASSILQIGNGGGTGSITGNVVDDGTLAFNRSNDSTFAGSISGSGNVTKSGAGALTLSSASSYAGGTTLSAGTLVANNSQALGTGTLTIDGGTLASASFANLSNDVAVNGDFNVQGSIRLSGDVQLNNDVRITNTSASGGGAGFGGAISGAHGITFDAGASMVETDMLGTTSNTYTGLTTVQGNAVLGLLKTGGAVAIPGDLTVSGNAVVGVLESGQIASTSNVTVNSTGQSLQMSPGVSLRYEGLLLASWNGPVDLSIGTFNGNGSIGLGSGTLSVGAGDFGGTISDGELATFIASQGGPAVGGKLEKTGSGTLTLTGANTYTGTTTVDAGTLRVNNTTGSATGSGAVLVKSGATLAGGGSVAGEVTIADGATLAPGNSPGSLTTGGLLLSGGSILSYELGAAGVVGGPLNELVTVNGNLVLDGTLNVAESSGGTFGPGLYRLIKYTGALTDNGLAIGTTPGAAADLYVQTGVASEVNLINSAGTTLNYWDGGDSSKFNDGSVAGGAGTWRIGSPGDGWAGIDGKLNTGWKQDAFAMFGGTAGTVTVDNSGGNVSIGGAQFFVDGYVVNGAALTLGQAETVIRVGDGTASGASMTATINAALTGAGGLTKDDAGTLVLNGANDYTGGTHVKAGVLQGNTTSLQGDIVNDAKLTFDQTVNGTYAGTLSGTGSLRKIGAGELQLAAVNSYSGGTQVDVGTVNAGITGVLGTGPVFVAGGAGLVFSGSADAGSLQITAGPVQQTNGGFIQFKDSASAGNATIVTQENGAIDFRGNATAGNATIENRGGETTVWFNATAGKAHITNYAGGSTNFLDDGSAGQATLVNETGGVVDFFDRVTADQATVVNKSGGTVRISKMTTDGITIGSLEGAGRVLLGAKARTTGGLNTSTEVSGVISGVGGSLVKVGTGTAHAVGCQHLHRRHGLASRSFEPRPQPGPGHRRAGDGRRHHAGLQRRWPDHRQRGPADGQQRPGHRHRCVLRDLERRHQRRRLHHEAGHGHVDALGRQHLHRCHRRGPGHPEGRRSQHLQCQLGAQRGGRRDPRPRGLQPDGRIADQQRHRLARRHRTGNDVDRQRRLRRQQRRAEAGHRAQRQRPVGPPGPRRRGGGCQRQDQRADHQPRWPRRPDQRQRHRNHQRAERCDHDGADQQGGFLARRWPYRRGCLRVPAQRRRRQGRGRELVPALDHQCGLADQPRRPVRGHLPAGSGALRGAAKPAAPGQPRDAGRPAQARGR